RLRRLDRLHVRAARGGGHVAEHHAQPGAGCKIGTLGGEDSTGARVALRYLPSEAVTLSFTYDYSDDNGESQADVITAIGAAPAFGAWNDLMFDTYGVRYDERFLTGSIYKNYATFRDPVTGLINDP